jgi:type IV fimbrial biogenesis protein FimT
VIASARQRNPGEKPLIVRTPPARIVALSRPTPGLDNSGQAVLQAPAMHGRGIDSQRDGPRPALRRGATLPEQRGVTIIESMIVIGIAAVLLAFAVPGFREFVVRSRLDSAAQEMLTTLQFARSEAARRGAQVTLRLDATPGSKNWGGGWTMFIDADRDGTLDVGEEVVRQGMALQPPLTLYGSGNFDTLIAFTREGRLNNAGGGILVLCQGPELTEGGRSRSRAVLVNGAGRVRMAARNSSNVPLSDTGTVAGCTNP